MKVLVTGAGGQLASDLVPALDAKGHQVTALSEKAMDICDNKKVREAIEASTPEVIVNCAAFTAVDECENQVDAAFSINTIAVANLAGLCAEKGIRLIHISTDYVFDGKKDSPYTEKDKPSPLNTYGLSKFAGEIAIAQRLENYLIIRTAALFGRAGKNNFVNLMLKLAKSKVPIQVTADQFTTPTYTPHLSVQIAHLVASKATGIVHCTAQGECSWYEFAKAIFEESAIEADLQAVSVEAHPSPATRPRYSVLDDRRVRILNVPPMPPWEDGLAEYLREVS